MIEVKVNGQTYDAIIDGKMSDNEWDGRESKAITLEATYAEVVALFPNDTAWKIVQTDEIPLYDENGNPTGETKMVITEYDNSEFCISGDIIDHRDGTCTIKMGKLTDVEAAYELLFGGDF